MRKLISALLIVVFLATGLVACNGNDKPDESALSSVKDENKAYKDADGNYVPAHEVKDLGQKKFTVIVRGSAYGTYASDDFVTNSQMYGELIDDATKKRNDMVEQLYNVDIDVVSSDNVYNDVQLDCQSSLGTYDAIMPSLSNLSNLATQGYLLDLAAIENFDIDAPWYDKNCTDAFSIRDQIYFTTGDITILNKVNTPSILFNKEMAAKYFPNEDFYQLVRDKKWTFDKLVESAQQVAQIVTSDGSYSDDNIYGMVTAYGDPGNFYGASGELICDKNAENVPYLTIGNNQRSVIIAQKILNVYKDANWLIFAQECEQPIWETSFAIFYEGRALFRPSVFSATTKLRSLSEIDFGVLPMPLMDENQDKYNSYCTTGATAGIAIPICAKDPEFSAYMIEACSAWAKNYITTAYYEVNLRYRDLRDNESEEMLDIIFDNIVYDIGQCYNFGGFTTMFYELTQNRSADIVSNIESRKTQAQEKIDELVEMYS